MPDISLTDFVDFAISTPPAQLTKIREIINRDAYDPRFDFWKPLGEGIQAHHQNGTKLEDILNSLTDPKKMKRYPSAIAGYKRFIKKHDKIAPFKPPAGSWNYHGLTVRVNPELGLTISGKKCAIKLYFKDEKPTNHRLKVVFELMRLALPLEPSMSSAVLDVANGRLIVPKPLGHDLQPLLEAQALAFMHLWKAVAGASAAAP